MTGVTTYYLEMRTASQLNPRDCSDELFRVREAAKDDGRLNRFLYEVVGEAWNWTDKLRWNDEQWRHYVAQADLKTCVAYYDGAVAGYYELLRADDAVEIAYFGLTAPFIGKSLGGPLLTRAIEDAWDMNPGRVWVHTCSEDHAAALANYQSRGMVIYKTEVEEHA